MVPSRTLSLVGDAELVGLLLLDQIERKGAHEGEVCGAVAGALARMVFSKRHIEDPVQAVLDLPVRPDDSMSPPCFDAVSARNVPRVFLANFAGVCIFAAARNLHKGCNRRPTFEIIDKM